jgi:hypothetical protein
MGVVHSRTPEDREDTDMTNSQRTPLEPPPAPLASRRYSGRLATAASPDLFAASAWQPSAKPGHSIRALDRRHPRSDRCRALSSDRRVSTARLGHGRSRAGGVPHWEPSGCLSLFDRNGLLQERDVNWVRMPNYLRRNRNRKRFVVMLCGGARYPSVRTRTVPTAHVAGSHLLAAYGTY